jgi:hypothetical protein
LFVVHMRPDEVARKSQSHINEVSQYAPSAHARTGQFKEMRDAADDGLSPSDAQIPALSLPTSPREQPPLAIDDKRHTAQGSNAPQSAAPTEQTPMPKREPTFPEYIAIKAKNGDDAEEAITRDENARPASTRNSLGSSQVTEERMSIQKHDSVTPTGEREDWENATEVNLREHPEVGNRFDGLFKNIALFSTLAGNSSTDPEAHTHQMTIGQDKTQQKPIQIQAEQKDVGYNRTSYEITSSQFRRTSEGTLTQDITQLYCTHDSDGSSFGPLHTESFTLGPGSSLTPKNISALDALSQIERTVGAPTTPSEADSESSTQRPEAEGGEEADALTRSQYMQEYQAQIKAGLAEEIIKKERSIPREPDWQGSLNASEIYDLVHFRKLGIASAPEIEHRLELQKAITRSILVTGTERYTFTAGDYARKLFVRQVPEATLSEQTRNHERLLSDMIKALLTASPDQTVIILDAGGGRGVSWCRLAKEYAEAIRTGKIAFVVSNLVNPPEAFELHHDRAYQRGEVKEKDSEILTHAREQDLVHFANCIFADLPKVEISLPNGTRLHLKDHVHLMHEVKSMTAHTWVPEYDIPQAAQVIAPNGVYMVGERDTTHPIYGATIALNEYRFDGIRLAHDALQDKLGLQRLETPEKEPQEYKWLHFTRSDDPTQNPIAAIVT